MKYFLLPLGCQMNQSDTERISTVMTNLGYTRTDTEEEASILGIVACSVRQSAINRAYSKIKEWNEWKQDRNIITFASGCVLPADYTKFLDRFDFVFRINDLLKLPDMLRQYGVPTQLSQANYQEDDADSDFWKIKPAYSSSIEAYVPIQNGCDKFCTFCAVPYTRGREVSRSSKEILEEVRNLIEEGYKSITLLGQNVNSYGLDQNGAEMSFAELLQAIGEMDNQSGLPFWLYFTSPHPRDMGIDVIETIANYPCLASNIHLPIQSGDDKMLIRMNRNYPVSRYREVVANIRALLPNATLFTDIITGFSGETDEQFENTVKIMHEFQYNMAYIAQYSPRPGAASFRWPDDVPQPVKQERRKILSEILHQTALAYNEKLVKKNLPVLVTGVAARKEGFLQGRTEGRLPIQFPSTDTSLIGQFIDVEITQAHAFSLAAELLPVVATK